MPVATACGSEVKIPIFITRGSGMILLKNEICSESKLIGPEDRMIIPTGVKDISYHDVSLTTYTEKIGPRQAEGKRTYLLVVPSKTASFTAYFKAN